MRQRAAKLWTAFALALVLAMSALLAPLTAEAEGQAAVAAAAQHEEADSHTHTGSGPCHKAAACEVPVALQPWQKLSVAENTGKLSVLLNGSGQASAMPEAHIPPPKA